MKLSDKQTNFIRLLKRSPDTGEGWRMVSSTLSGFAHDTVNGQPELYETRLEEGTLYVRLSERGQVLGDYI